MPAEQIGNLYDLENIQQETNALIEYLKQAKAGILDVQSQRITLKGADVSSFTKSTEDLNKAIDQSTASTAKAVTANQQLTKAQIEARLANQQRTAAIKEEVISSQAAAGSYNQLQSQLKTLTLQYKAMGAEQRASAEGKELQQSILNTNAQLKIFDADLGNYQRNVGNYNSSLGRLAKGLKGLGGLGRILADALGIDPEIANGIREAGRAVKDIQHARELEEVGLKGEIELYEQSKDKIEAFAGAADGAAVSQEALTTSIDANVVSTEATTVAETELTASTEAQAVAQTELIASTAAELTVEEQLAALQVTLAAQIDERVASELALAASKDLNAISTEAETVAEVQNVVATKGAAAAQETLAVATVGTSTAMKVLVNVLKFSGIALAVAAVAYLVYEMVQLSKASKEAARQMELQLQIEKESAEAYGKEAGQLEILRAQIESTNTPMAERLQAIKDIKEQYPDYFAGLTNEQILTGNVADAYDRAAAAILRKAQASAAANQIEKNAAKELLILQEDAHDSEETNIKLKEKSGNTTVDEFGNVINVTKQTNKLLLDAFKTRQDERKKEQEDIRKDNEFLLKYAINNPIKIDKPDKEKKGASDSLQATKEILNTEFDRYKIAQDAKIRLFDADIKNVNTYYLDKLNALDGYVKAEKELLDKEEANEILNAQNAAAREIKHLEEEKSGKNAEQKARIDQNIKITEENLQQQILLIQVKYADQGTKLAETTSTERQKILDDHLKTQLDSYEAYLKQEQDAIDKSNAAIKKGYDDRAKAEEEAAKKEIELNKELNEKKSELAIAGEGFLYSLATAGYQRQLDLLTDQGKKVQIDKDAQLAANDALVQSAEQKAANIIIINSRAQAQQDVLDRRAAEIKNRQAIFERGQQIFEIGIQTIKAIGAIKLQAAILLANPLTAALAPFALSQIPFALGTAALSIAAILAQPLPHYKHGRGEAENEFAIVGDGGVNEYIHRSDGTIEQTPAVETLAHLMPKDRVYPNKAAMMKELALSSLQLSDYQVNKEGGITKADMETMTGRIEEAVGSIKIITQLTTKDGQQMITDKYQNHRNWVNKYIKN